MIKVFFSCAWQPSWKEYFPFIQKQTPYGDRWKDMIFVEEPQSAHVVVVFDGLSVPYELIKNKPIIYFQREPEYVRPIDNFLIDVSKKTYTYEDNPPYVFWWLNKSYKELKNLKYEDLNKDKDLISIVSNKSFTYGQKLRLNFLNNLQHKVKIDFYGRTKIFDTYNGKIPEFCKFKTSEYNKALSFENGKRKNFFTRTTEDQLCWTLPLYWGCPNLDDWIPKKSYRWIDIESAITKDTIDLINEPVRKEEIEALEEARNKILDEYNFWSYVYERTIKEV